jgi:hypothetical protein
MTGKVSENDQWLERAEVEHLLSSGMFQRAPLLARLLTYVCEKRLSGQADELKEYNIAVEALGRPADFDQRRDAIVRVEAHRLRKRLDAYYEGEGACRPVRILLPAGKYVPEFVRRAAAASEKTEQIPAPASPRPAVMDRGLVVVLAGLGLLALGLGFWTSMHRRALASGSLPMPAGTVRILAGGEEGGMDRDGNAWLPDRFYSGGEARSNPPGRVQGVDAGLLFRSRREGAFDYAIPLNEGIYELRLYFAETEFGANGASGGAETSRIFHVTANGKMLLPYFDVASDAGADEADVRVFTGISPAGDGKLHLSFRGETGQALVNAIEITPGDSGGLKPMRILCQEHPYADRLGRIWGSDRYFRGGKLVERPLIEGDPEDGNLYTGERFGNLVYTIPVAAGRYDITLHFAERWFGPGMPGGGGVGNRRIDILCNGTTLERDFDILKEAGAPNKAVVKVFHNLEPNPQGKLVLSLEPSANYACINAIEVTTSHR